MKMSDAQMAQLSLERAIAGALVNMPDGTSLEKANARLADFGVTIRRGALRFTANVGNCQWVFPEEMVEFSPSVCAETIKKYHHAEHRRDEAI